MFLRLRLFRLLVLILAPFLLCLLLIGGYYSYARLIYVSFAAIIGLALAVLIVRRSIYASRHADPANHALRHEAYRLSGGVRQAIDNEAASQLLRQAYGRGDRFAGLLLYSLLGRRPGNSGSAELADIWTRSFPAVWQASRREDFEARYLFCLSTASLADKPAYRRQLQRMLPESAQANFLPAINLLGRFLEIGQLAPPDLDAALQQYRRSANQGSAIGISGLGRILSNPQYAGFDIATALGHLQEAAGTGEAYALLRLGEICEEGIGMEADPALAREYYARAAQLSQHEALRRLAWLFMHGVGGDTDFAEARRLLEQALQLPWDHDKVQALQRELAELESGSDNSAGSPAS